MTHRRLDKRAFSLSPLGLLGLVALLAACTSTPEETGTGGGGPGGGSPGGGGQGGEPSYEDAVKAADAP